MDDIIGKGWSFPPHFNKYARGVDMASDTDEIEQSLTVILTTAVGDRLFHPDFGCNIEDIQFKSVNSADVMRARRLIEHSIIEFEPRIILRSLDVNTDRIRDGVLGIYISYSIKESYDNGNMIHPFYFEKNI